MKLVFLILALLALHTRALEHENVEDSMNEFAMNFHKTVSKKESGNFITSPLSAYMALAMAASGSRGVTQEEFFEVLRMPKFTRESAIKTFNGLKKINEKFQSSTGEVDLIVANKLYAGKDVSLNPRYQDLLRAIFKSDVSRVNFDKPEAVNTINTWANNVTRGMIKELLSPGAFDGNTKLVLLNAVYFNGQWQEPFDKKDTRREPFHVSANVVKDVKMMFQERVFNTGSLDRMDSQFVRLDYKDGATSMYFILPNQEDGLAGLEQKMESLTLKDLQNTRENYIKLLLPKFQISSTLKLEKPLVEMGLTNPFTDSADFNGIMEDGNVPINRIVQKIKISVDEVGTEAAAVAYIGITLHGVTPTLHFDRPFMVVLATEDVILFTGRVVDPTLSDESTGRVVEPTLSNKVQSESFKPIVFPEDDY